MVRRLQRDYRLPTRFRKEPCCTSGLIRQIFVEGVVHLMSKKIVFSGLSPLLYVAAYLGEGIKEYELHYIGVVNMNSADPDYIIDSFDSRLGLAEKWVKIIAESELVKYKVSVDWGMVNNNDVASETNIVKGLIINDGDYLSTNSINFIDKSNLSIKANWLSEGDLNFVRSLKILMAILVKSSRFVAYEGRYKIPEYLKFFGKITAVNYDLLTKVFDVIVEKDLELQVVIESYKNKNFNYVYVPTDEIECGRYQKYLELQFSQCDIIDPKVLIKPHPRDQRDYVRYFENIGVEAEQVSGQYIVYPSEVFSYQLGLKYFGGISTSLLSFPIHDIDCCIPSDRSLIDFYREHYKGLLGLLNVNLNNCGSLSYKSGLK